jgi:hypothetical protein
MCDSDINKKIEALTQEVTWLEISVMFLIFMNFVVYYIKPH